MQMPDANVDAPIALPEGLYRLNAEMRIAVTMEDFANAALLRDAIKAQTSKDPVACLLSELREAVDDQEYETAKSLKLKLAGAVKARAMGLRAGSTGGQYKVNRLLILGTDGSLQTTDPSGACPVTLSEPGNAGKEAFMQPCWSPGGDLVVATKVELAGQMRPAQSKER
jgi:hypothetical protein